MMRRDLAVLPRRNMLREDEIFAARLALAGPWGHVPVPLAHRHRSEVPTARSRAPARRSELAPARHGRPAVPRAPATGSPSLRWTRSSAGAPVSRSCACTPAASATSCGVESPSWSACPVAQPACHRARRDDHRSRVTTSDARRPRRAPARASSGWTASGGWRRSSSSSTTAILSVFPGYPQMTGPWWAGWMIYGHLAVVVFIVLSGFSLAVGPARHGWRLDGLGRYAHRRAWRILSAYWPALVFSMLMAWVFVPQPGEGAPTARSAVVYGLLVQDVTGAPSPNGAFWSIAIEAQLYVLLPLLFLLSAQARPGAHAGRGHGSGAGRSGPSHRRCP